MNNTNEIKHLRDVLSPGDRRASAVAGSQRGRTVKRDSIIFPLRWFGTLLDLPEADLRAFLAAIRDYAESGTEPTFSGLHAALWREFRDRLDHDAAAYAAKIEKRRAAGIAGAESRWKTVANGGKNGKCHKSHGKNSKRISAMAKMADGDGEGDGDIYTLSPLPLSQPSMPPADVLGWSERLFREFPAKKRGNPLDAQKEIVSALIDALEGKTTPDERQKVVDGISAAIKAYSAATESRFLQDAATWFHRRRFQEDFGTVAEETPKEIECKAKPMIEGL